MSLAGKVAIITGASRGIGRECAMALGRAGVNVVVAAKSTTSSEALPGSIHSVAAEVRCQHQRARPAATRRQQRAGRRRLLQITR